MHFCHEELFAIMAAVPGLSYLAYRVREWWHEKFECKCKEVK